MEKLFVLFLGLCLFSRCSEGVKLIYSPDNRHCISQLNITDANGVNYTLFAYGKVNSNQLPNAYIKVKNKWSDAWYGLIKWNGEEATLYYIYQDFEAVNLEKSSLKMDFMNSEQEFSSYFFDKTPNDFIKVSRIKEYNSVQ